MRAFQHIKASNLLSFGPDGLDLELLDLNILIGPNGSGKSNFLEIFELLKSLPRNEEDSNNLQQVISRGGGANEWIHKNAKDKKCAIEVTCSEDDSGRFEVLHEINFNSRFFVQNEIIQELNDGAWGKYQFINGRLKHNNEFVNIPQDYSGLSLLSTRTEKPLILSLSEGYERIRLYREWSFGRNSIFRVPQRADLRNDRLEQDFSNLGMVLSRLRKDPVTKRKLIACLQDLYAGLTDFEVIVEGNSVQVFFTEGDFNIPATRLSDGSLRYLCLLAILLDPTPPQLICIEEPELGLHPDMMPRIADLLRDAATRTQLIVTTHSDALVDAFSEQPEAIVVCEKNEGQSQFKRLDKAELTDWLKEYGLGQLWTKGEIGGTRW